MVHYRKGDRITRVGHDQPKDYFDLWANARFDEADRIYVGVASNSSKIICIVEEARMAAHHWHYILTSSFSIHSLWTPPVSRLFAVADAFAEGNPAGVVLDFLAATQCRS